MPEENEYRAICRHCKRLFYLAPGVFKEYSAYLCGHCRKSDFFHFRGSCIACSKDTYFHQGDKLEIIGDAATAAFRVFTRPDAFTRALSFLTTSISEGQWGVCSFCRTRQLRCPNCKTHCQSTMEIGKKIICSTCSRAFSHT